MDPGALKRIFEHPEKLLEVSIWACCSQTIVQETLSQSLKILFLQFHRLLKAIIVLNTHASSQIVIEDAWICNLNRLHPGLTPILGRFQHRGRLTQKLSNLLILLLARFQLVRANK